jgi:hypothetical protein
LNFVYEMWERFQKAVEDPLRMQQFYNSDLGLPYAAMGHKITSVLLDQCVEPEISFTIDGTVAHVPADRSDGPCTMGIDVGSSLDVRISKIVGRNRIAQFIGKIRSFDEAHDLIDRYNVEVCVVDSMPEITLVTDFQMAASCDTWLCRYTGEGGDRRTSYNGKDRIILVDRTLALDKSFAKLRQKRNKLPTNYKSVIDGVYVTEMCFPVRQVVQDNRGNSKFEWTKGVDHSRHSDAYDNLAFDLFDEVMIGDVNVV